MNRFSLRFRVYSVLAALVMITILGGLVTVWYTYRMEGLFSKLVDRNVAAFQAAEALQSALVNQKGYVSYYLQDSDQTWLKYLEQYRQVFNERFQEALMLAETDYEKKTMERIGAEYGDYVRMKDQVLKYYLDGEKEKGARLHSEVREHFSKVLQLCDEYKDFHARNINEVRNATLSHAGKLRIIAGSALLCVLFLAVLLSSVLVNQILEPVRRLAREADRESGNQGSGDEVKALSRSVRGLLEEFDFTQTELEKSREHLLQAEKMATLGKLAANTAHSIRNPLTSVKMRLFSLQRSPDLTKLQKEDLQVISEETLHIDNIVQNFLEFSRPPKLRIQRFCPSEVVDLVIRLLAHRFEIAGVKCRVERKEPLPLIYGDPERLKEVLVNLMENACEAMATGGSILIREETMNRPPIGDAAVIRLSDSGPGIPEEIRQRVFEPFFSTKEEGSGLGLSIAFRIVQEHGGLLELTSQEGFGACFVITLPTKEKAQ